MECDVHSDPYASGWMLARASLAKSMVEGLAPLMLGARDTGRHATAIVWRMQTAALGRLARALGEQGGCGRAKGGLGDDQQGRPDRLW